MLYLAGFIVLVILALILIYNKIISDYNRVKQAWSDVLTQERQKEKVLPKIETLASDYKEFEASVLKEVTKFREGILSLSEHKIDAGKITELDTLSKQIQKGLKLSVEAYPELKSSELYLNLMNEFSEQEEQVSAALRIFNSNVAIFNTGIESFPNNIVNNLFAKKESVENFTDNSAEKAFDYKPDL